MLKSESFASGFSGAKPDYRSEMMRRDINGKLDDDGIKMGQAVETGVTILARITRS